MNWLKKIFTKNPFRYIHLKAKDSTEESMRDPNVEEDAGEVGPSSDGRESDMMNVSEEGDTSRAKVQSITYRKLVYATAAFRSDYFVGECGFGKDYKGRLPVTNEVVVIKQLEDGKGINEFVAEVQTLGQADHPNLVKLIGYCAEGDHRLLVHEYMPLGSLESHLRGPSSSSQKPLDWDTRMKIASGVAKGLEYLHNMKPPILYFELTSSNVVLGEGYLPKLWNFGVKKLSPVAYHGKIIDRYGYLAPEYFMAGLIDCRSDIYSFGFLLWEIITGRKPTTNRITGRQLARLFSKGTRDILQLADPALRGHYHSRGVIQALIIVATCIRFRPQKRSSIAEVITTLDDILSRNLCAS